MRILLTLVFSSCCVVLAQQSPKPATPALASGAHAGASEILIPAGTKVPVSIKNALSSKSNHPGDPVYAQTTFPVVINDRIVIPAGTYMQGRIMQVKPATRGMKSHAEILLHFTTLIYPSGYTVILPGSLDNAPGVNKAQVKDKEGTIKADNDKGSKAAQIAIPAAGGGAMAGGIASGTREGTAIGAGMGAALGVGIAMLSHGNEVTLPPGTTLEVVLQRDVPVDGERVQAATTEGR